MAAIDRLKVYLGERGRADFETNAMGADLVWRDERYAFFLLNCVWDGCAEHNTNVPAWESRICARRAALDKVWRQLEAMGWRKYYEYDCKTNLARIADTIVADLATWTAPREAHDFTTEALARLAREDAVSRSSNEHWRDLIAAVERQPHHYFTKTAVREGLIGRHAGSTDGDWDVDLFEDLWETVKHHGVLGGDTNGFYRTDLLGAVKMDLGL